MLPMRGGGGGGGWKPEEGNERERGMKYGIYTVKKELSY